MRKVFGFLLLLAFSTVVSFVPVKASPNYANVILGMFVGPSEITVSAGDTVILRQGWIAMDSGLVRMYLHQSDTNFTLSNDEGVILLSVEPTEAAEYWGPIAPRPDFPECHGDREAGARWDYPLPVLEPGDYAVDFHVTHHAPLTDGCDGDGDGQIDFYPAEVNIHKVIHVVPE